MLIEVDLMLGFWIYGCFFGF